MNKPRGFAIVSTVLVLCIVIILLAAGTALRLANELGQGTDTQRWNEAQRLAEGCAETALMEIRRDPAYAGNETVSFGADTCTIRPVLLIAGITVIQTEATVDGHPYRLEIELDDADAVNVTSWAHVTVF